MLAPTITVAITVAAGTGTATAKVDGWGEYIGLKSPDATPKYDFELLDEGGFIASQANRIDAQIAKIADKFRCSGDCTFRITGAADPGVYTVKLYML